MMVMIRCSKLDIGSIKQTGLTSCLEILILC